MTTYSIRVYTTVCTEYEVSADSQDAAIQAFHAHSTAIVPVDHTIVSTDDIYINTLDAQGHYTDDPTPIRF